MNAEGVVVGSSVPLNVTFVDQSSATSGIASRAWDFNSDGVIDSAQANPTFAYPTPGHHSVTLHVSGNDGALLVNSRLTQALPAP